MWKSRRFLWIAPLEIQVGVGAELNGSSENQGHSEVPVRDTWETVWSLHLEGCLGLCFFVVLKVSLLLSDFWGFYVLILAKWLCFKNLFSINCKYKWNMEMFYFVLSISKFWDLFSFSVLNKLWNTTKYQKTYKTVFNFPLLIVLIFPLLLFSCNYSINNFYIFT